MAEFPKKKKKKKKDCSSNHIGTRPTWTPVSTLLGYHIAVRRVNLTVTEPVAMAQVGIKSEWSGQTAASRTCAVRRVGYTSHFGCGDETVLLRTAKR